MLRIPIRSLREPSGFHSLFSLFLYLRLTVWNLSLVPNTDGIDTYRSDNVALLNWDITCGDDCLAIKGVSYPFESWWPIFIWAEHDQLACTKCYLQWRKWDRLRISGTIRQFSQSSSKLMNNWPNGSWHAQSDIVENVYMEDLRVCSSLLSAFSIVYTSFRTDDSPSCQRSAGYEYRGKFSR